MSGQIERGGDGRVWDFVALGAVAALWVAIVLVGPAVLGTLAGWVLVYLVFTNGLKMLAWVSMGLLWLVGGLVAVSLLGGLLMVLGV